MLFRIQLSNKVVEKDELLKHIHALPKFPSRVPYRTSYYKKLGFCCTQKLIDSKKFIGPFKVFIDSKYNNKGKLNWLEYVKGQQKMKFNFYILLSSKFS